MLSIDGMPAIPMSNDGVSSPILIVDIVGYGCDGDAPRCIVIQNDNFL